MHDLLSSLFFVRKLLSIFFKKEIFRKFEEILFNNNIIQIVHYNTYYLDLCILNIYSMTILTCHLLVACKHNEIFHQNQCTDHLLICKIFFLWQFCLWPVPSELKDRTSTLMQRIPHSWKAPRESSRFNLGNYQIWFINIQCNFYREIFIL